MKEKIKKYWWIVIIILIISGVFYWYQIRPSQIYSNCHNLAVEKAIEKCTTCPEGKFKLDDYEGYYKMCLRKEGINE